MSKQFQREHPAEDTENINQNNFVLNHHQSDKNSVQAPNGKSYVGSANSSENMRNYFQDILLESEKILNKIDQFNSKTVKNQEDFTQMEAMFAEHVCAHIHPTPNSNVGDILLRNGKFIVAFIQIMTRHQKKDYLQQYLYNYFNDLNKISKEKEYFQSKKKKKQQIQQNTMKKSQRNNKQTKKKIYMPQSPQSSKNQINWSVATQQDLNSSPKSLSNVSSLQKQKLTKLKRQQIDVHELVNQQNQKSEKATKNVRKSIEKRSQKKTKQKTQQKSVTKTKQKTQQKSVNKSKRSYKKRSPSKSNKKSIVKSLKKPQSQKKSKQNIAQNQLGSCYHYLIAINKKNQNKQLKQVRTSARLSKKKERVSIDERRQSFRKSSKRKSIRNKSNTKKNKRDEKSQSQNQQVHIQSSDSNSQYRTQSQASEHSDESQQNVDWIKHHLKQLHVKDVQMYADFKALTENDQKITDFLLQMENSQQANNSQFSQRSRPRIPSSTQQNKDDQNIMKENVHEEQTYEVRAEAHDKNSILKPFQQIKQDFQIKDLPLTIDAIIDPDLNNHGIYALVRLGRVTELEMGTAYAVSPLTYSTTASRKFIKEDLQKAKQLAGEYGDNIGYIPMNQHILEMIKQKKQSVPH